MCKRESDDVNGERRVLVKGELAHESLMVQPMHTHERALKALSQGKEDATTCDYPPRDDNVAELAVASARA